MKKPILLGIVFILLAGVLGGFAYFEYVMKPEIIKKAVLGAPQPTPSVVSEAAETQSWRRAVPAIGTLTAIQGIDVAPEAAGIIQSIGFESGQEVDAGDLLVELDDGTEQASLKAAQAQLRNSQANLKR
jgi:membrane fusion protein (multidrug efflux system)